MARIDKYDPTSGGFRAPLAADYVGSATPVGVGLDVNGRVVPGAGHTGIVGVLCNPGSRIPGATVKAGDTVDVMTDGELVEFAGAAGTSYTINTVTGAIGTAAPDATHISCGFTVEATRLVVRMGRAH